MAKKPRPEPRNYFVVVDPKGKVFSDRRKSNRAAWANAALLLGHGEHFYSGEAGAEEVKSILKGLGYSVEKKESGRSRVDGPAAAALGHAATAKFLHMRINNQEQNDIAVLVKHYQNQHAEVTVSWIVRELISRKIEEIKESRKKTQQN